MDNWGDKKNGKLERSAYIQGTPALYCLLVVFQNCLTLKLYREANDAEFI